MIQNLEFLPYITRIFFIQRKYENISQFQWSTKPKQDSVLFGIGSGSVQFFQENRTEYLQDKIKYKRVSRSFNRNIFVKKIQLLEKSLY